MHTTPKKSPGSIRVEAAAPLALDSVMLCIEIDQHEIMIPLPAPIALGIARDLIDKTLEHTAEFTESMMASMRKANGS